MDKNCSVSVTVSAIIITNGNIFSPSNFQIPGKLYNE